MANAKKFETPADLERHIKNFIIICETSGQIPDDYALCKYLHVSPATLDRYRGGEGNYKGWDEPLKMLTLYREHRLLQILESDPKAATSAIFQLKQVKNGGYSDNPGNDGGGATVTLRIAGVGGEEAFK